MTTLETDSHYYTQWPPFFRPQLKSAANGRLNLSNTSAANAGSGPTAKGSDSVLKNNIYENPPVETPAADKHDNPCSPGSGTDSTKASDCGCGDEKNGKKSLLWTAGLAAGIFILGRLTNK